MENEVTTETFYHAWCEGLEMTYINSWKISQLVCNSMKHAATEFVKLHADKIYL